MKHPALAVSLLLLSVTVCAVKPAHAEVSYPNMKGLTPFTMPANYMSLPGCLRWRYFTQAGRWLSRSESRQAVINQGASARLDPTRWHSRARNGARQALPATMRSQQRGF